MTNYVNLLCYEIITRIEANDPQAITPYLSSRVDYRYEQDAPNLLFVERRLIYKEGTQDEAKMRRKERLYIERIFQEHHLQAEIKGVEVMHEHTFSVPAKYVLNYNPVCFSAYFAEGDTEENG